MTYPDERSESKEGHMQRWPARKERHAIVCKITFQKGERSDEGLHSGQVMLFPGRLLNCNPTEI